MISYINFGPPFDIDERNELERLISILISEIVNVRTNSGFITYNLFDPRFD